MKQLKVLGSAARSAPLSDIGARGSRQGADNSPADYRSQRPQEFATLSYRIAHEPAKGALGESLAHELIEHAYACLPTTVHLRLNDEGSEITADPAPQGLAGIVLTIGTRRTSAEADRAVAEGVALENAQLPGLRLTIKAHHG